MFSDFFSEHGMENSRNFTIFSSYGWIWIFSSGKHQFSIFNSKSIGESIFGRIEIRKNHRFVLKQKRYFRIKTSSYGSELVTHPCAWKKSATLMCILHSVKYRYVYRWEFKCVVLVYHYKQTFCWISDLHFFINLKQSIKPSHIRIAGYVTQFANTVKPMMGITQLKKTFKWKFIES